MHLQDPPGSEHHAPDSQAMTFHDLLRTCTIRTRMNTTMALVVALFILLGAGGADTADAKLAIMQECGFTVTRNPSEMAKLLKALLK